MQVVLFEDSQVSRLAPITLSRPAYAVTCGAWRLVDLANELARETKGSVRGVVRSYLDPLQDDYLVPAAAAIESTATLLLNARLAPDARLLPALREWVKSTTQGRILDQEVPLAVLLPSDAVPNARFNTPQEVGLLLESPLVKGLPVSDASLPPLLSYPHEVIARHLEIMDANLEFRLQQADYREVADGVFVRDAAPLPPHVVCDSSSGKILIEPNVKIGPFSVLQGPLYLASDVEIAPHALLKGFVSSGRGAKVGGEISKSIVEPYTNKRHYGYLGNAYLGSWVNLGAGTTNSNLKNTYGSIRVEYGATKVDTGLQFLGCVIGDFTKTAINTSIFTGKMIGVCSNVYGTVTTNVPSFSNYARSLGDVTDLPPAVMAATQERMFARRGRPQRACDVQLLRDMYELERQNEKLANRPLSL